MIQARKILLALVVVVMLAAPVAAAPAPLTKAAGTDADKWLLNDAEAILVVNLKQMKTSKMFKDGEATIKSMLKENEQIKVLADAMGADLMKDVDTVLLSASGSTAKDAKALLVVRGRFDTAKAHKNMEKLAKDKPDEVKLEKSGTYQLYKLTMQDQTLYAGFANKNTMVATTAKDNTVEAIKNGGKKSAKISKDMTTAVKGFSDKDGVCFALVLGEDIKKQLAKVPGIGTAANKMQTVTGNLQLDKEATLKVSINTEDAKAAKTVSNLLTFGKGLLENSEDLPPIAVEAVKAIKIGNSGNAATATLTLTKALIEKATKGDDK